MAVLDISCPNCRKKMKVPDTAAGKKIRCKECEHVFAVPAPARATPAKPKPKPAKAAPPPPDAPIQFLDEPAPPEVDDDNDNDDTPFGVVKEGEVARCPHCAYELDPPDTRVCLNCGYDMVQRRRHESKKVIEHTTADYALHWMPAIIWLIVIIALIVVTVICFLNMRIWLTGSFLDKEEKNATTFEPEFYVGPGCFTMVVTLITLFVLLFGGRFAYKRLVLNWRPVEVEKKK